MMCKNSALDYVALILVLIGALNWGLVGILDFNFVATLFGDMTVLSRIIYILVGLAGLYMIYAVTKCISKE